jgi:Mg2+ and Co2+ transporter CorA
MTEESSDRRIDVIEDRVKRVEDELLDTRRQMGELTNKVHTVHMDLVRGNGLAENTRDAVIRIERSTKESFDRIEKHTKESLDDLRGSVKDAVDMATAANQVRKWPLTAVVAGIVAASVTFGMLVIYLKS